jgi:hypothetical protein
MCCVLQVVERVRGPVLFASLLGIFVLPENSWCIFSSLNSAVDINRGTEDEALYYRGNKTNE